MEWNVEHIAEREEASGAREWSREIRSWKFLSRAAMWLQDQARPARQGKARPDAANHPPHLVSSTRRCAFGERPETLERCSFVAVPEGPVTVTDESQDCVIVSKIFCPRPASCGSLQSRRSVSQQSPPSSSYFLHFSSFLAFSAYTSAYFLVTPNCVQVRAPEAEPARPIRLREPPRISSLGKRRLRCSKEVAKPPSIPFNIS
jgi:hypothetical protein